MSQYSSTIQHHRTMSAPSKPATGAVPGSDLMEELFWVHCNRCARQMGKARYVEVIKSCQIISSDDNYSKSVDVVLTLLSQDLPHLLWLSGLQGMWSERPQRRQMPDLQVLQGLRQTHRPFPSPGPLGLVPAPL